MLYKNIYADTIKISNQYHLKLNNIQNMFNFDNIYNNAELTVLLTLFQNKIIPEENNGFLGINFDKKFIIHSVHYNNNRIPDIIIELGLYNFRKLQLSLASLTKSSITIKPTTEKNLNFFSIKKNEEINLPYIIKDNKLYILIDYWANVLERANYKNSEYEFSDKRISRIKNIFNLFFKNKSDFLEQFKTELKINDSELLSFFYSDNTNGQEIKDLQRQIFNFVPETENNNTFNQSVSVTVYNNNQIKFKKYNYIKKDVNLKFSKLNFNDLKNIAVKNPVIGFISFKPNLERFKDLISKYNFDLVGLNYYLINIIDEIQHSFNLLYFENQDKKNNSELENLPVAGITGIKNKNNILIHLNEMSKTYSDKVKLIKLKGCYKLNLKNKDLNIDLFLKFLEGQQNYFIWSTNEQLLNSIEYTENNNNNSLLTKLNKIAHIADNKIDNSCFYFNLKKISHNLTDIIFKNKKIQKTNTLTNYIISSLNKVWGYSQFNQNFILQNLIINYNEKIDINELYKMIKNNEKQ
jgi:hypothetical protein